MLGLSWRGVTILNGFRLTFLVMNWRQYKTQNSTFTCFIAATCWSLGVWENPERRVFVNIRQKHLRNQEKPSCSLVQPGVSYQLTNQIVLQVRQTNQSDCHERVISKEQGLAAGILSPLLPFPLSNFCRNACMQANLQFTTRFYYFDSVTVYLYSRILHVICLPKIAPNLTKRSSMYMCNTLTSPPISMYTYRPMDLDT